MSKKAPLTGNQNGDPVDWESIHRRLDRAARTEALSDRERLAVLEARAEALARIGRRDLEERESLEIIEFNLAGESYGVELDFVREVHSLKDFTPLPGAPPFVLGIINLRGEILSVVDLKKFFSLPERGLGELNKVIVIHNQRMEFGILADVIVGTRRVALEEINPTPPTVTGIGAEFLRGVTLDRLVVINAQRVLEDKEIIVQQDAE